MKKLIFLMVLFITSTIFTAEPAKPKVIFITGTSCSGKSTITKILQTLVQFGQNKWEFIAQDDDLDACRPIESKNLCYDYRLILGQILQFLKNGSSVICDAILYKNEEIQEFLEILKNYNVLIVLIHCPIETLVERAHSRASDSYSPQADGTSASKAIGDYTELYRSQIETNEKTVTKIPSMLLLKMRRRSISETSQDEEEMIDHLAEKLKLDLDDQQEACIEPEYDKYNLIIDTSREKTEDSIEKLVKLMKS